MKKTIGRWLKEYLTEEQYKNAKEFMYEDWYVVVDKPSVAIAIGFYRSCMPEGYDYWEEKIKQLVDKGK